MNISKIKELRSKIKIPLNKAIELLKEYDDDISTCIKEFHQSNMKEIILKTECDEELVLKNYYICKFDKNKTITRLNNRIRIITTGWNPDVNNKIGFILYPTDEEGKGYKTEKRNDVFIPAMDFEYIRSEVESVFPLDYYIDGSDGDNFYILGHNSFGKEKSQLIVDKIKNKLKTEEDNKIRILLQEIIDWFEEKLIFAKIIVIYGNL